MKKRKKHGMSEEIVELNLNSMMDLFAVLIPALLMMSAVVEVCVLNVSAPAVGPAEAAGQPNQPEKEPLNLTVSITNQGYIIAGNAPGLISPEHPATAPSIPVIQKEVTCSKYRGTWPTPRERNKSEPPCKNPLEKRKFWVYDQNTLIQKIKEIKKQYPNEHRIIIAAEPHVEYESVIDVMDATRDYKDSAGATQILFDEPVLSPGVF